MAMITTVALVLGLVGPQEPPPSPAPAPTVIRQIDPLSFLWPDSVGLLALRPTASVNAELATTALPELLDRGVAAEPVRELLAAVGGWLEEEIGFGSGELIGDVGRHGLAVAWHADGADVSWAAVVGLDDSAQPLAEALDRAADSSASVSVSRANIPGASAWTVKVRDLRAQFVCAIVGQTLLLAPDVDTARGALERARDPRGRSLANSKGYTDFIDRASALDATPPLLVGWLDLGLLAPVLVADVPAQHRSALMRWLGHLGLDRIGSLGWAVTPAGKRIHERYLVEMSGPRPEWIEALLPADATIDASVAMLAPRDVVSFGVSHVRIAALYQSILGIVDQVSPEVTEQLTSMTEQLSEVAGIDLPEMIGTLGDRTVTMQWPDGEQVMVIDVADPRRLSTSLRQVQSLEGRRLGPDELFLPAKGSGAAIAISRAQLIIAPSEARLRSWLDQQKSGLAHPSIQAFVQSLPTNVSTAGWLDFAGMAATIEGTARLATASGPREAARMVTAMTDSLGQLGQVGFDVTADAHGYVLHVSGPMGGLTGALAASLGSIAGQFSAGDDLRAAAGRADALRTRKLQRLHDLLSQIRLAELRHREERGGYADLATLITLGYVEQKALDGSATNGAWRYSEYLVSTVFDQSDPQRAEHFVIVAWPDGERRGDVYACTDRLAPMCNELLARSSGVTRIRARDVFVDGNLEGTLAIGWRPIEEQTSTGDTPPSVRDPAGERTRFEKVVALEQRGAVAGNELIPFLDDPSPVVVARAAWALGTVQCEAAVPRLVQLASPGSAIESRRHALRALWKIHDARSIRVSIEALADEDAQLRELAAANLGALKAKQATENLLGLVGRASNAAEEPSADRSAALLALAEFGDPRVLIPAATAIHDAGKVEEQSLTWLFQTLSPTLPAEEEAKALIVVLDHQSLLLRRYAIQRLGELRAPNAVPALESRLAAESAELRGLVEVSLAAIRGTGPDGDSSAKVDLAALWEEAQVRLEDPRIRAAVVAGLAALLVMVLMFGFMLRRRRRWAQAAQWAAYVEPSSEFAERKAARRPRELKSQFEIGSRR